MHLQERGAIEKMLVSPNHPNWKSYIAVCLYQLHLYNCVNKKCTSEKVPLLIKKKTLAETHILSDCYHVLYFLTNPLLLFSS